MTTNLTAKQQYWSEHILCAERSGQSLAEYAKAQNIPVQKLYQWRSSLKKMSTTRTIQEEVQFTELVTSNFVAAPVSLQHQDTHLTFGSLPDADWLAHLLKALHLS